MTRFTLGYIHDGRTFDKEDKLFSKLAKKNNIELVPFSLSKDLENRTAVDRLRKCNVVLNNSAQEYAVELIKTLEEVGNKVIDSSKAYYYLEDKWMFYLKCKEFNIQTPETILLSENLNTARKELKEFNRWPVILKRVYGTCGEFVERAENVDQAVGLIQNFWKKGNEKLPIIAQEFISSPSYRLTVIGGRIVQTALKENKGWKATGVYATKFKKFDVDKELERLVKRVTRACKINICGIDLLKKDNKWFVVEVNSEPAFDFFDQERGKLISEVLTFLKKRQFY